MTATEAWRQHVERCRECHKAPLGFCGRALALLGELSGLRQSTRQLDLELPREAEVPEYLPAGKFDR